MKIIVAVILALSLASSAQASYPGERPGDARAQQFAQHALLYVEANGYRDCAGRIRVVFADSLYDKRDGIPANQVGGRAIACGSSAPDAGTILLRGDWIEKTRRGQYSRRWEMEIIAHEVFHAANVPFQQGEWMAKTPDGLPTGKGHGPFIGLDPAVVSPPRQPRAVKPRSSGTNIGRGKGRISTKRGPLHFVSRVG